MTPLRIATISKPSRDFRGLLPMDKEQERFWQLRRERKEQERKQ